MTRIKKYTHMNLPKNILQGAKATLLFSKVALAPYKKMLK